MREALSNQTEPLEDQLEILSSLPGAITAQDPTGRLIYANEGAADSLGFASASELLAAPLEEVAQRLEIYDEQGRALPPELLPAGRVLSGEPRAKQTIRYRRPRAGEEAWARVEATPVFGPVGDLRLVVSVFHDITEEKRAERELEAHARQQEALVELGRQALGSDDLDLLFATAAHLVATSLGVPYSSIFELAPSEKELLLRAGAGWDDRYLGKLRVPVDNGSEAGYTLLVGKPVVVDDLAAEERFTPHSLMLELGLVSGMSVIIRTKARRFGVLGAYETSPRRFAQYDLNFLQAVANVLAEAIQSRESEEARKELLTLERDARTEAEGVVRRLHAIQKVTDAALAHLSLDDLLAELLARIRTLLQVDTVAILLPCDDAEEQLCVRAALGLEEELEGPQAVRMGRGVAGRIAASREPLVLEDLSAGEVVRDDLLEKEIVSLAGVPLLIQGDVIGVIQVGSRRPRHFEAEEVALLQLVADRAASAIDRSRLYEQERAERLIAEQSREKLAFLARASQVLSQSLDYRKTLGELARLTVPKLADWFVVDVLDDGTLRTLEVAHSDPSRVALAWELRDKYPLRPEEPFGPGNVARTGEPELYEEISDRVLELAAHDEAHLEILRRLGLGSAMIVALTARGRTFGAISFITEKSGRRYGAEDLEFATDLARRAALAIDNARLFADVQRAEQRFRALVQSLGAIFWEAEPDTLRFRFVSRRAEEILGYPSERWKEPGFWATIVHPEDRQSAVEQRLSATQEERDVDFEYRAVTADGQIRWLKDIVHVVRDEAGQAKHLRGVMVDISDQKQVEHVLQESKDRYAHLARTLQKALLPPALPHIPGFQLEARYHPAGEGNEVGGDFYDVFEIPNGGHAIVIGDVCGKGPRAATLTGLARHTLRATASYEDSPSQALRVLNDAIQRESSDTQFATVVYTCLQPTQRGARLKLASGGHPLPLLLRADETLERVGTPGTLLGVISEPDLTDDEVDIGPGDAVIFYTDGVTVERGPEVEPSWLPQLFRQCAGLSASEIADKITHAAVEFLPGEPRDDIALLVLRVGSG